MINCIFENNNKASLRHVVVNAIILKEDKVLLVKRSEKIIEGDKWGLPGGFVDRDETIKEAIGREIFEETGYKTKNTTLLTIIDNPNRPNDGSRQNIAFVFFCDVDKKEGNPDWESTDQQWFFFDKLPKKEEIAFDHYEFIQLYLKYQKESLPLPISQIPH